MIEIGDRPTRHRGAFCSFDVPAGALVAGGVVYQPPASGAVIAGCSMAADVGAASMWRLGVVSDAVFAASTFVDIGGSGVFPLWPGGAYNLTGVVRPGQHFGIGDRMKIALGQPYENTILVMPGNVFFMALEIGNLTAEGGFFVHEFLNPDEFEQWASSGR